MGKVGKRLRNQRPEGVAGRGASLGKYWASRTQLRLFETLEPGDDVVELGCGTAALPAWLARRKIHPVAADVARTQLQTAKQFQRELGLSFPLIRANGAGAVRRRQLRSGGVGVRGSFGATRLGRSQRPTGCFVQEGDSSS